jgi:hypothetical protein
MWAGVPATHKSTEPVIRGGARGGFRHSTAGYWDPPLSRAQQTRQELVAIVLAFALAALLDLIGF